jgi:hypothetical protein
MIREAVQGLPFIVITPDGNPVYDLRKDAPGFDRMHQKGQCYLAAVASDNREEALHALHDLAFDSKYGKGLRKLPKGLTTLIKRLKREDPKTHGNKMQIAGLVTTMKVSG